MGMVSPNDMMKAAKEMMLDGREPETKKDWYLVMNFVAANIHPEVAPAACEFFLKLYDIPLTKAEVNEIVNFQLARA